MVASSTPNITRAVLSGTVNGGTGGYGIDDLLVAAPDPSTVVSGFFADEVLFLSDPGATEDGPTAVLGAPDDLIADLDAGGATLRFSQVLESFEYPAPLPSGTEIIITHVRPFDGQAVVGFGYGSPADVNGDGVADAPAGLATLLGSVTIAEPPWGVRDAELLFFDLDTSPDFAGFTDNFFLFINDEGDFDLDAVHLLVSRVPEPGTVALLGLGLAGLGFARRLEKAHRDIGRC